MPPPVVNVAINAAVNAAPVRTAVRRHEIGVSYSETEYGRCRYSRCNHLAATVRVTDDQLQEWLEEAGGDVDDAWESMQEHLAEEARSNAETVDSDHEEIDDYNSTDYDDQSDMDYEGNPRGILEDFLAAHPELAEQPAAPTPPLVVDPAPDDDGDDPDVDLDEDEDEEPETDEYEPDLGDAHIEEEEPAQPPPTAHHPF